MISSTYASHDGCLFLRCLAFCESSVLHDGGGVSFSRFYGRENLGLGGEPNVGMAHLLICCAQLCAAQGCAAWRSPDAFGVVEWSSVHQGATPSTLRRTPFAHTRGLRLQFTWTALALSLPWAGRLHAAVVESSSHFVRISPRKDCAAMVGSSMAQVPEQGLQMCWVVCPKTCPKTRREMWCHKTSARKQKRAHRVRVHVLALSGAPVPARLRAPALC